MGTTLLQIDEQVKEETTLIHTEQQIEDFCKSAHQLCQFHRMPSLVMALQIIRQLQEALSNSQAGGDNSATGKQ